MRRILKDDLKSSSYKMKTRHELTVKYESIRLDIAQIILDHMAEGTLPNLVFSDEKKFDVDQCVNHQNDRVWSKDGSETVRRGSWRQNPASVMVWIAVTATGRSLVFVPSGVKLNSERYISHILEAELLPYMNSSALRWCTMDLATRLRFVSWLKNDAKLYPGLHFIVSEQIRMAFKESWFKLS